MAFRLRVAEVSAAVNQLPQLFRTIQSGSDYVKLLPFFCALVINQIANRQLRVLAAP